MATVAIRARTTSTGERRYQVRYRRGGRYTEIRAAGTFKTRRDAETRAKLISDWIAQGLDPQVELARALEPSQTVADLYAEWLASRRSVTAGTLGGYRYRWPTIDDAFGDQPVDSLTVTDIVAWVGDLEREYKPGTVRLFVSQLRMILDYAGGTNVARDRRVELPRVIQAEPDPPDAPEVEAMLQGIRDDMLVPALIMEYAGLRVSETMALTRDDLTDDTIRVRREAAKGQRHGRQVQVPELLAEAVADRVPFRGNRSRARDAMRAVSDINPHQLRHRRATLWYQAGVGPVELARRLGHAKASMSLDVYVNVKPLRELDHASLSRLLR